jgi:DNA-binding IclR family transcriptional regulator
VTGKLDPSAASSQGSSPPTERVISVLELLGREPNKRFSLAEICRRLDISRATGHAIVTTLAAREWVVRDPATAGYSWGPAVTGLGRPANARLYRADLQALATDTGTQVSLARREGATLLVVDTVGECLTGPKIWRGMRMPFVAPFGRDYVAWSDVDGQKAWMEALGTPSREFRQRMTAVLPEIRRRGYVVERLTREYVRVYAALRALSTDGEVDEITTHLARAFADVTAIDILDDELSSGAEHSVATVSAPIRNADGVITMAVMAAVFATLGSADVHALGQQVRSASLGIEQRIARHGDADATSA